MWGWVSKTDLEQWCVLQRKNVLICWQIHHINGCLRPLTAHVKWKLTGECNCRPCVAIRKITRSDPVRSNPWSGSLELVALSITIVCLIQIFISQFISLKVSGSHGHRNELLLKRWLSSNLHVAAVVWISTTSIQITFLHDLLKILLES